MENSNKNVKVETVEIKEPESYKEIAEALEKENKVIKKKYDELRKEYESLIKDFNVQAGLTKLAAETIININNVVKNYDTALNVISNVRKEK